MLNQSLIKHLVCCFSVFVLFACGGGGGSSEPTNTGGGGTGTSYNITLSQNSLQFEADYKQQAPAAQTIQFNFNGEYVAVGMPPEMPQPSWLDFQFAETGSGSYDVSIQVNTTQLIPGTGTTTIRFVTGNSAQTNVVYKDLTINYVLNDVLYMTDAEYSGEYIMGSGQYPDLNVVTVVTFGQEWTLESDQDWLALNTSQGNGETRVHLSYNQPSFEVGDNLAQLTLKDSDGNIIEQAAVNISVRNATFAVSNTQFSIFNGTQRSGQFEVYAEDGGNYNWEIIANNFNLLNPQTTSGTTPDSFLFDVDLTAQNFEDEPVEESFTLGGEVQSVYGEVDVPLTINIENNRVFAAKPKYYFIEFGDQPVQQSQLVRVMDNSMNDTSSYTAMTSSNQWLTIDHSDPEILKLVANPQGTLSTGTHSNIVDLTSTRSVIDSSTFSASLYVLESTPADASFQINNNNLKFAVDPSQPFVYTIHNNKLIAIDLLTMQLHQEYQAIDQPGSEVYAVGLNGTSVVTTKGVVDLDSDTLVSATVSQTNQLFQPVMVNGEAALGAGGCFFINSTYQEYCDHRSALGTFFWVDNYQWSYFPELAMYVSSVSHSELNRLSISYFDTAQELTSTSHDIEQGYLDPTGQFAISSGRIYQRQGSTMVETGTYSRDVESFQVTLQGNLFIEYEYSTNTGFRTGLELIQSDGTVLANYQDVEGNNIYDFSLDASHRLLLILDGTNTLHRIVLPH